MIHRGKRRTNGQTNCFYNTLEFLEATPVPTHRTLKGFWCAFFFFFVFCNKYLLGKESIQKPNRQTVNVFGGIQEVLTTAATRVAAETVKLVEEALHRGLIIKIIYKFIH